MPLEKAGGEGAAVHTEGQRLGAAASGGPHSGGLEAFLLSNGHNVNDHILPLSPPLPGAPALASLSSSPPASFD